MSSFHVLSNRYSSTTDGDELTRYTINLSVGSVVKSNFPNIVNNKFVNTFDFPTINEQFRGRSYCYVYGVSAFAYSRTALVKKNVCNGAEDKVGKSSSNSIDLFRLADVVTLLKFWLELFTHRLPADVHRVAGVVEGEPLHVGDAVPSQPERQERRRRGASHYRV